MPLDSVLPPALPTLRGYQAAGQEALFQRIAAGKRRLLLCGPTGSGKAVMMCSFALHAARRGLRTIVAVHTDELILHHHALTTRQGARVGVISAGFPELVDPDAPIQIASVFTLANRLRLLAGVTVLLVDEAHHAIAQTWRAILGAAGQNCLAIGFSATPLRLDGRPLDDVFDDLVLLPQPRALIGQGWLVAPKVFAPPSRLDTTAVRSSFGDFAQVQLAAAVGAANVLGDAVREYRRHAHGLSALAFTVIVDHAETVAAQFCAAGYRAAALSGETPRHQRRALLEALRNNRIELLASCQILGEGLDVPGVRGIIMLRPTQSLTVYLQQCGRASRPDHGKSHYILLDLVGNVLRHGLPHEDRVWSLSAPPKRSGEAPVWICAECHHVNPGTARECENCGAAHTRPERKAIVNPSVQLVEETDPLALLQRRMRGLRYADLHRQPRTLQELTVFAELRGYKPGWLYYAKQDQYATFGRWPS
jgi:superfamily II DNA or RNA helicase